MTTVVVIGVGNEWRRDDGVGWVVARAATDELGDLAQLVLTDGEPARLLDAWDHADLAVVIDAARTGADPGTVHVLELEHLGDGAPSPRATHALGVAHAARLGAALGRLPAQLVVVGVEAADVGDGPGLTASVAAAVGPAVAEVCRAVRDRVSSIGATREG